MCFIPLLNEPSSERTPQINELSEEKKSCEGLLKYATSRLKTLQEVNKNGGKSKKSRKKKKSKNKSKKKKSRKK